jgi:hypothetical protein
MHINARPATKRERFIITTPKQEIGQFLYHRQFEKLVNRRFIPYSGFVSGKRHTKRSTISALRPVLASLLAGLFLLASGCSRPPPDLTALGEKCRSILELQSCEFIYHDIIYQGKTEKLLGLLVTRDTRLLFSVDIRVSAGIDLQNGPDIVLENLPAPADGLPGLVIQLPAARILDSDADENTIHQYFLHEYGLDGGGKVNWLDFQDEIAQAKKRAETDALKRGLLDTAWDNAAASLGSFFRLAGFGEVKVKKAPTAQADLAFPPRESRT